MMKKTFFILVTVLVASSTLGALEVYKDKAVVSYYAEKFHGRKTANGETFNMNAYTCAHKSLPFNTMLRMTNLANGKSVDVRVNDRGPFVKGREADLSKAAAAKIGMLSTGTANVKIEIVSLGAATKQSVTSTSKVVGIPTETKTPKFKVKEGAVYDIQIYSFREKTNAENAARKLIKQGFSDVILQKPKEIESYRVVIRKVAGSQVPTVSEKLSLNGYSDYIVRERKVGDS